MAPLLRAAYVQGLYEGRSPSILSIANAYINRVRQMLSARRYDVLWIERELLPWLPAWCDAALLSWMRVPAIIDYDDAQWERYKESRVWPVRVMVRNRIEHLMSRAQVIIAGNQEIAKYAASCGARWVECIPTVVDIGHYDIATPLRTDSFRICWIGTPITSKFLKIVTKPLVDFCRLEKATLVVIGAPDWRADGICIEHIRWSEDSEATNIARCDIGIMPLYDGPFERGKCGYKLLQYMACKLPVIASPIGVNRQLVKHGVNGFWASTEQEWVWALNQLHHSRELRAELGRCGRKLVEQEYSVSAVGPRLVNIAKQARHAGQSCSQNA